MLGADTAKKKQEKKSLNPLVCTPFFILSLNSLLRIALWLCRGVVVAKQTNHFVLEERISSLSLRQSQC